MTDHQWTKTLFRTPGQRHVPLLLQHDLRMLTLVAPERLGITAQLRLARFFANQAGA